MHWTRFYLVQITEKQLRDVFIKHGTVTEVKIMRCNDNNVSKGCVLVMCCGWT